MKTTQWKMLVIFLGLVAIYILGQNYIAEKIFPNIPHVSLCRFTFGTVSYGDYASYNSTICYKQRLVKQHDWRDCFEGAAYTSLPDTSWSSNSAITVGRCIAEISHTNNINFCSKLPESNVKESCSITLSAIKKSSK